MYEDIYVRLVTLGSGKFIAFRLIILNFRKGLMIRNLRFCLYKYSEVIENIVI